MDDYNLGQWGIEQRCALVKKLNNSLHKLEQQLNIELPQVVLDGNKVNIHILYFKNFMYKLLHRIKTDQDCNPKDIIEF